MDLSNHLESIVSGLVQDIQTRVNQDLQDKISSDIDQAISEKIDIYFQNFDINAALTNITGQAIQHKVNEWPINTHQIEEQLKNSIGNNVEQIKQELVNRIHAIIRDELEKYDITQIVQTNVEDYVRRANFPAGSIPATSIDFTGFRISGDSINGGIINDFSSMGIDDRATSCQLTILDNAVVVEQKIVTTGLDVRGDLKAETVSVRDLKITGNINPDSPVLSQIIDQANQSVFNQVRNHGLETPQVVFDQKVLLNEQTLGSSVLTSSLRKTGTLENLQTKGETLLDNTLYIRSRRVGVNTLEPAYALTVWDDETETVIMKQSKNRSFLGSQRNHAVTLGAGGKDNISLDPDGSVTINDLRLGALPLGTASSCPNWAGRTGEIVFNDSPQVGLPIGWVCLQGHRWAKFGTITD
jgi:hypothetical protein